MEWLRISAEAVTAHGAKVHKRRQVIEGVPFYFGGI